MAVLSGAMKLSLPTILKNVVAAGLALVSDEPEADLIPAGHVPGVKESEADALSRLSQ